jgi:hypothetical protein
MRTTEFLLLAGLGAVLASAEGGKMPSVDGKRPTRAQLEPTMESGTEEADISSVEDGGDNVTEDDMILTRAQLEALTGTALHCTALHCFGRSW